MTDKPPHTLLSSSPADGRDSEEQQQQQQGRQQHSHANADPHYYYPYHYQSHIIPAPLDLNAQHAAANSALPVTCPTNPPPLYLPDNSLSTAAAATTNPAFPTTTSQIQFRSTTIAPSPPPPEPAAGLSAESNSRQRYRPGPLSGPPSAANTLRIHTEIYTDTTSPTKLDFSTSGSNNLSSGRQGASIQHKTSSSSLRPVSRTPSVKTAIANSIGTASAASSTFPSPIITAMGEVTPLPSPLLSSDSPGPWKRMAGRPPSTELMPPIAQESVLVTSTGESIASALANASKRKAYTGLLVEGPDGGSHGGPPNPQHSAHARNRSVSEYIPDPMLVPKRQITVSGSHIKIDTTEASLEPQMRRELNLAESRGLTPTIAQPPTPPPSESSKDTSEKDGSSVNEGGASAGSTKSKSSRFEYFEAYGRHDRKKRRWRAIKLLGQGTFSRVMLATSQMASSEEETDEDTSTPPSGVLTPTYPDGQSNQQQQEQPDLKTLVAVKVCEHGPRGGASEDRIEMSLKRELEIMQSIHHPSLVHLKAWNIEVTRAILVLSYCPGGDLFDVATAHREVLVPSLLRRMFSELIGAVSYLHERRIVHRDIKLESKSRNHCLALP
jgi:protein-serine/threonine kinase